MHWSSFGCGRRAPDALIIVDPSLRDLIGHHAEYDRAVARAAQEAGIAVTVLAHRGVTAEVAAAVPCLPVFSDDIWRRRPARVGWKATVAVGLFHCVQLCVFPPIAMLNL